MMTRIEVPNSSQRRRSSGRGTRILVALALLIVLGAAGWTWLTLSWSYAEGERGGVLQKFQRTGWLCKTDEGELAMYVVAGIAPQVWSFSVRDPATEALLRQAVGHKCRVPASATRVSSSTGSRSSTTRSPTRPHPPLARTELPARGGDLLGDRDRRRQSKQAVLAADGRRGAALGRREKGLDLGA
jgi:hypothetical protein